MPDDANGNYTLPSGYLAVTGQTIQSSQHNPPLEDVAAALTGRLPRSGVAPMTGPVKTITGSASAPAIYPNNNPAVGIYWTSTGIAFAGTVSGIRYVGELIPYTFLTPEPLTVLPYGQTLLRASYPDLWAKAQTDIAAGNVFYNNGNGSTTFGIGDLRGRVIAGKDNMGGTAAGRLTGSYFGATATNLGAAGGVESLALSTSEMPQHNHGGFTGDTAPNIIATVSNGTLGGNTNANMQSGGNVDTPITARGIQVTITNTNHNHTIPTQGNSAAHNNVQPTLICNFLLYAGA